MTNRRNPVRPQFPAVDGRNKCKSCGEEKDVSEFALHSAYEDKLQPRCRDCRHIRRRNPVRPKFPAVDGRKTCQACGVEKDVSEFALANAYEDKLQPRCRDCGGIRSRYPAVNGVKLCQKCREPQGVGEFYRDTRYTDGLQPKCKSCTRAYHAERYKDPEKRTRILGSAARWRERNPDSEVNKHYRRKYGITLEDYTQIEAAQGGLCAVCRSPEKTRRRKKDVTADERFAVDHCHDTGLVRGLLCFKCNTAIGSLGDTDEQIRRVIEYLSTYVLDPKAPRGTESYERKPRSIPATGSRP